MHASAVCLAIVVSGLLARPICALAQELPDVTYTLQIDCAQRGILNEGTRAPYSIVGVSDDGEVHSFTPEEVDRHRLTERDCLDGVAPFTLTGPFHGPRRITRFVIEFEALVGRRAHDALLLDSLQFTLTTPDFEDSMGWDEDGGDAWCLSAGPDDGPRDWRGKLFDGVCFPCIEFRLIPTADDSPIIDGDWRGTALPGYAECAAFEGEVGQD